MMRGRTQLAREQIPNLAGVFNYEDAGFSLFILTFYNNVGKRGLTWVIVGIILKSMS